MGVAMRGLDLLLLACCLCSLSTLGGKAQADTTCPYNKSGGHVILLTWILPHEATHKLEPTRKYQIYSGSQKKKKGIYCVPGA